MITMTDILSFWLHGPDRPIMCRMIDGRIGSLEKPPGDLGEDPQRAPARLQAAGRTAAALAGPGTAATDL